jgi:hypothetical protein
MLDVILQSFVLRRTTLPTVILLNVVAPRANHLQSFPGNAVLSFKIRNNKIRVPNFIKHFFSSPFTINQNKLPCSSMTTFYTQEPTLGSTLQCHFGWVCFYPYLQTLVLAENTSQAQTL